MTAAPSPARSPRAALERLVGDRLARGRAAGPSGSRSRMSRRSIPTPLPWRADTGTISSNSPSSRRGGELRNLRPRFWMASTLFTTQIAGRAGGRDCSVDERVARADARGRVDDVQDDVDARRPRRRRDRSAAHRAASWVCGSPGVSVNTICAPSVVPDRADAAPGRLRLVGDDRDLLPDERVHERGLADVRPPDHRDDAAAEGRSSTRSSGSNGAREQILERPREPFAARASRRRPARSGPNSQSTCRHAPHGGRRRGRVGHDRDRVDPSFARRRASPRRRCARRRPRPGSSRSRCSGR